MSRKRKYSDEFRIKMVLEYLSGQSGGFGTIANKYGLHTSIVQKWVHKYEMHGAEGLLNASGSYSGEFKISPPLLYRNGLVSKVRLRSHHI